MLRKHILFLMIALLGAAAPAFAIDFEPQVQMEDMTWPEIQLRMKDGATVVIIPTGGTEQNGPHIVTGKHNYIVRFTAGQIARKLGNALVAPVLAYVPEGRISPPEGHMRFPGTVSVSESAFGAVLEDAARSYKQHGFRLICFIGDHGGSKEVQERIADKLNAEWRGQGAQVLQVSDYYSNNGQKEWVAKRLSDIQDPQAHAGLADTAEMLSLRPEGVREDQVAAFTEGHYATLGASGDATGATSEIGRKLLSLKVDAAVEQIRHAEATKR